MGSDLQFRNEDKRKWSELTDKEKGCLLLAFYEGRTIEEWWSKENEWEGFAIKDGHSPAWELGIWRIKPEPVTAVHWAKDSVPGVVGWWYDSKEDAKSTVRGKNCIALIRRTMIDGKVVSYALEEV